MSSVTTTLGLSNWKPKNSPADASAAERPAETTEKSEKPAAEQPAADTSKDSSSDGFRKGEDSSESSWGGWFNSKPFVREIPKVPAAPRTEKPVIGILVQDQPSERSGGGGSIYTTGGRTQMYADAVEGQGGFAHFIWDDGRPVNEQLKGVHGLLIPGGPDLNPSMYGQEEEHGVSLHTTPLKFDTWEKSITETAIKDGITTRGICRGHQLLNVMFPGGTLQQDIQSVQSKTRPYPYTVNHTSGNHPVAVVPGTTLAGITNTDAFMANSYHHQAVGQVGEGLQVSARSADGTIEGIENQDGSIIGVQFHPERDRGDLKTSFFTDFVTRANHWRQQHDPLSADELASLMKKAEMSRQTINANGGEGRRQAIFAGLANLDNSGWEVAYRTPNYDWKVANERNFDEVGGKCEVRGRRTHKVAMASETERGRDEMLLSLTDQGIQHLPQDVQDVLLAINTATDLYKGQGRKCADLFKANWERIANPIEVVWALRQGEVTFTPPDMADTKVRSPRELAEVVQRAKARREPTQVRREQPSTDDDSTARQMEAWQQSGGRSW
ncbi:MAG TPA: gamma-glutamyl-gamma-aminobutyrate hydrolase family protein [Candidatus Xenobia bacterium]|jgi:putative glutamine amidotransferase